MAINNPKVQINYQDKKINNSRETYFSENENLIIGKKGLTFQYYPTKKEKLKYYLNNKNNNPFSKTFYTNKNFFNNNNNNNSINNSNNNSNKTFFNNRHINKNFFMNNIQTFQKSFSQTNFFKNPNKEKELISYITIDINNKNKNKSNMQYIDIPSINRNASYETQDKFNNININNINYNNKFFSPIIHKKFKKIKYPQLSKLQKTKKNGKKNKNEKISKKTHFKALESIYIHPKEIYDLFKKEDAIRLEKLGIFNINDKKEEEHELIEKRNEYKSDIKELIKEEQDIRDIINTKEFSELMANNKFYREAEYNDRSNYSNWEEESKNFFFENEEEKMEYLRKIAFEEKKDEKTYNNPKSYNSNYVQKNLVKNKKEVESNDESFFEEIKKSKKRDNINILMEMEDQLRVEGKVYHMKNQMDKICKELLNKYKIHKVIKK